MFQLPSAVGRKCVIDNKDALLTVHRQAFCRGCAEHLRQMWGDRPGPITSAFVTKYIDGYRKLLREVFSDEEPTQIG